MKSHDYLGERPSFVNIAKLNGLVKAHGLRAAEVRIIFWLMEMMNLRDRLEFTLSSLASALEMDKGNVSRSLKKIREAGILVGDGRGFVFNPEIAFGESLDDPEEAGVSRKSRKAPGSQAAPERPAMKARPRTRLLKEPVYFFAENFDEIVDKQGLAMSDLRVVSILMKNIRADNRLELRNADICRALGMEKSNVSRAMKRLREAGIIFELEGALYFNPHIACRGALDDFLLDYSAMVLDKAGSPATPSFGTPNILKKIESGPRPPMGEASRMVAEYYA